MARAMSKNQEIENVFRQMRKKLKIEHRKNQKLCKKLMKIKQIYAHLSIKLMAQRQMTFSVDFKRLFLGKT